jgi:hypothetical protein
MSSVCSVTPDLTHLRKVAEAAKPGDWRSFGCLIFSRERLTARGGELLEWDHPIAQACRDVDAAHIAAFDPPTVLALLDRLERAEAVVAEVDFLSLVIESAVRFADRGNHAAVVGVLKSAALSRLEKEARR